jgi:hypothetical protein
MSSWITKLGFPSALGLSVGDGQIAISRVVAGPLGPIEIHRHTEQFGADELTTALKRIFREIGDTKKPGRLRVAIGLPTENTFFATRPLQNVSSEPSPHALLREALRSTQAPVQDMAVDVLRGKPDRRSVVSIAACPGSLLKEYWSAVGETGTRLYRAEPAPAALLRTAAHHHRAPRSARFVIRIFLSDTQLLAVAVARNHPIAWRLCPLSRGDEGASILASCRTLLTVARDSGVESPLDLLMLHGRPDLMRLVDTSWLESQLTASIDWHDRPPLSAQETAFGLALGCLNEEEQTLNLARGAVAKPSIWEIFPWREAALQVALILGMAFFLCDHWRGLCDEYDSLHSQNAQHLWADNLREPQLLKEKNELQQKVTAVQKYLNDRVRWSDHGREVTRLMPDALFLTSMEGTSELAGPGNKRVRGKPDKSLVVRGAVPLKDDGTMPTEIDRFVNALRNHPALHSEFPVVELADLKQQKRRNDEQSLASFTVTCLPKKRKKNPG